jgi:chromatin remodeling complex protein RSC6
MAAKNNALNKPVNVSPALEAVVGKGPLTRAEVTSKVWAYIKANGLQDSVNKRNINPDAKLAEVTGKDQITMFQLTSLVSKQLS